LYKIKDMSAANAELLKERVERALDEVRPHLAVDGGNVELIEISNDLIVKVKWLGSCEFCSMSAMTMKAGVQEIVRSKVPEITAVIAINGVAS
jgi:Fe-S cluster biogenesis protein NfuA